MTPTDRESFKAYCLRKIGFPVHKINASEEQLQDRIDEALKFFADYHYDGTSKKFFKYQITDTDRTNKYIPVPEGIIGITGILPIADAFVSGNFFNIRYQYMLNNITDITSHNITPYYIARQYMELLEEIFVGDVMFRFNRHENICYIDINWDRLLTGQYLILECYEALDPEVYTNIWGDRWLQNYTTQLFKRQWGENLSKFVDLQLVGGNKLNGEKIYAAAQAEIDKLEELMVSSYSLTPGMLVG